MTFRRHDIGGPADRRLATTAEMKEQRPLGRDGGPAWDDRRSARAIRAWPHRSRGIRPPAPPCPIAGSIQAGSRISVIASERSRRINPASAKTQSVESFGFQFREPRLDVPADIDALEIVPAMQ